MFTNPRPDHVSAHLYYRSDSYISHDTRQKGIIPALYSVARSFTVKFKYRLARRFTHGNTLLDLGCGTGEFLCECRKNGLRVKGVEPSIKAREFAINKYNLNIVPDFLKDIPAADRFDCITLWHVLEHIHSLPETMNKLREILNPGGVIIVALPNSNSYDAAHYGKFWAAYDLPRHIYHFNRQTFSAFASGHSLSVIKVLPQKLDAYYISLLSEKYKTGSPRFLSAILTGLISNLKGKDPKKGHSSEIYILKLKNS